MGLYGILVVTCAPTDTTSGCTSGTAYPGVTYAADVPLLLSEIDPVQNTAVSTAVNAAAFSETLVWSGQPGGCGNPNYVPSSTTPACYPPTVNYTPLYYLINGVAFDKTHASASLFPASPGTAAAQVTGTVLVRLVNAGLHMHVPAIVGSQTGVAGTNGNAPAGFSLIAEDGNPLPGVPRVQSEVFMAAGKTYDVMINVPAAASAALPIYDRELSLSSNATARDSGMLAYISVNGAAQAATSATGAAVARADTYNALITGNTLTVSDPAKGVIANDTNVYGVQLIGTVAGLTLNANGTFTYTGAPTSFNYCANGTVTGTTCSSGITATVTLGAATLENASGITINPDAFASNVSTSLSIKSPGVLANDVDALGYALTVNGATLAAPLTLSLTGPGTGTVTLDPNGGFNASVSAAGTYTFTYQAMNSQGTVSTAAACSSTVTTKCNTVTLTFPTPSGLTVSVLDGTTKAPITSGYRWIIEEDRTFYIDPNCTTNPQPAGCPTFGTGQVPTFGTNFHTSYMPVVATGCTAPTSGGTPGHAVACEDGQTLLGVPAVCDIGNGVCRTTAQPADPRGSEPSPSGLEQALLHFDPAG